MEISLIGTSVTFQSPSYMLENFKYFEYFLNYMITDSSTMILKIGSKGEIFPPKAIREKLGFEPDQPIIMFIHEDQLIVRKLNSIEEILNSPTKMKISYHAWKQFKEDLTEEYES